MNRQEHPQEPEDMTISAPIEETFSNIFKREEELGQDDSFKAKVVVFFSLFISIWAPIYSPIMYFMTDSWVPFISTMVCGTLLAATVWMYRRGWTYVFMGNWLAFNLYWIESFLPFLGGINFAPLLWLTLCPLMAAIVAGTRSGLVWLGACVVTIAAYYILLSHGHDFGVLLSQAQAQNFTGMVVGGLCVVIFAFTASSSNTLRHRLEAIRRSEHRTSSILDTVAEAILMVNEEGKIETANPAARVMFDLPDDGVGLRVDRLIADLDASSKPEDEIAAWVGRTQELTGRRYNGSGFPIEVATGATSRIHGEGTHFVITIQDITERRAAEEAIKAARDEALQASRTKSAFLANMSHELRTPLNAIIGYSDLVVEEFEDEFGDGESLIIEDLNSIRYAGKHLLQLINDVLDISKIEAGHMELYLEEVELEEILEEVVATVQPLVKASQNRFKLDVEDVDIRIETDRTKLRQILLNLLSNAAKFTHDGIVRLHVNILGKRSDRPKIIFEVQDTGKGIAPDKLDKLFEAFVQEDSSTSRKYGGTGLGLSLSRSFAEMMGGHISVSSVLGEGSTFRVVLPLTQVTGRKKNEPPRAPSKSAFADHSDKLLVIDDDPEVHVLVRRFMSGEDVVVLSAFDGETGMSMAKAYEPTTIMLDVLMPRMDGWEVLRQLKADPDLKRTPVVMSTIVNEMTKGRTLGADDYLIKPIDRTKVIQTLRRFRDKAPRVLVVEDEQTSRDLLERLLSGQGWDVDTAVNGLDALDRIHKLSPDLVLLDLMMPELDGFGVLEQMRSVEETREIPVVVVTAMDLSQQQQSELRNQATNVIHKGGRDSKAMLQRVSAALQDANFLHHQSTDLVN